MTALSQSTPGTAGVKEYISLLKPRVMALVTFTACCSLIAAPGPGHIILALSSLIAVALGAGAAASINMWFDQDIDAKMHRTRHRPVPRGLIDAEDALAMGMLLACLSLTLITLSAGILAAALLAASISFYVLIYTVWLKRKTDQNIVIGGAAGAFPPVIGWAAASGETTLTSWLLFALIFFWTPVHFWALALWTRKDYAVANIPMLPVTKGAATTRAHILAYTLILTPVAATPAIFGTAGTLYLNCSLLAGAVLLILALRLACSRAGEEGAPDQMLHARRLFHASNLYLLLLFGALALDAQGIF